MERRLFKAPDAAHYLAITKDELYDYTLLGEIRYVAHGTRGKRWDIKDLDAFIERRKR